MPCRFLLAGGAASIALMLTTACAPGLTPQQEVTWDAFKACQKEGAATLDRIAPDGGWYLTGREDVHKISNCMRDYWRKGQPGGAHARGAGFGQDQAGSRARQRVRGRRATRVVGGRRVALRGGEHGGPPLDVHLARRPRGDR